MERRKKILFVTFLVIGSLFYILNSKTPLFADDYSYSFSWYDGERISGLKDILLSQYKHYFILNGRFVLHFLAQLFLWLGKSSFNVVNTGAFLVLGILVFYHGFNGKLENHVSVLIFIYCILFISTPAFGQSFLWITGASNYLYGIELVLLYLIPYRYVARKKHIVKSEDSVLIMLVKLVGMFFFGVLAGWTNENLSVALVAIVLAFIVFYKFHKNVIFPWMLSGWVGNFTGCILVLASPGEQHRLDVAGHVNIIEMIENIVKISVNIADYFRVIIILFIMLGFLYVYPRIKTILTKKFLYDMPNTFFIAVIYGLGFLGASYSMIVAPYFPARAWSGPLVLLLITFLSFYSEIIQEYQQKTVKYVQITFVTTMAIISCCIYINAYVSLRAVDAQYQMRMMRIEECIKKEQSEVYLPVITSNSKYSCYEYFGDLGWNSDTWTNTVLARYYGISKVIRDDRITE